jgi:hypothetical protein
MPEKTAKRRLKDCDGASTAAGGRGASLESRWD